MTRYKKEKNKNRDRKGGATHSAESRIRRREELEAVAQFPARLDCLSGRDKFRFRPGRLESFVRGMFEQGQRGVS
jgi:hypothetical protein